MLQSYFLFSIFTLSLTYSWYSLYGVGFFSKSFLQQGKKSRLVDRVPTYMWDIYNNGINSTEIDIVKSLHPKSTGSSIPYKNYRRRQLEFNIPNSIANEVLVKAELRITTTELQNTTTHFQIYLKTEKWIFLDQKKVSDVSVTWVSLQVMTPNNEILKPGPITLLILTLFQNGGAMFPSGDFLHPVLLLSYNSGTESWKTRRKKRNSGLETYEEETNRIWGHLIPLGRGKHGCRRKSLYIEFSEIDYDTWIVAPNGYDAFQCVGKCTFPVGEHLSPTKHAILQTLLHNISPWKTSRACCVPTRLEPISILYVDKNGVLTYRFSYQDMVVAECGCR